MDKISKSGSVEKALKILDYFSPRTPFLTLQQLSNEIGYPKTTLFRLLCSLEKFGYIRRKQENGVVIFGLGWSFLEKASLVSEQIDIDIKGLAKNEMLFLRNKTDLSVQLAIRDGKNALYIEQIPSLHPIRIYPEIGKRVPLYSAACPRVLMAYLSEYEQETLINDLDFQMFTANTIIDKKELRLQLYSIIENGFAVSKGELLEGTIACAAPIFNARNEVIASLSVIGMEKEISSQNEKSIIESLKSSANKISNQLKIKNHI